MSPDPVLLAVAALLVVGALGPCVVAVNRGDLVARLVAVELAAPVTVMVCLVLAAAFDRPAYLDVGLVLAVVTFPGSMVYARYLERWL